MVDQHAAQALENIGRRQGPTDGLQPAGQSRNRIIDAAERLNDEHQRPNEIFRPKSSGAFAGTPRRFRVERSIPCYATFIEAETTALDGTATMSLGLGAVRQ
jgi:hypothetical protein